MQDGHTKKFVCCTHNRLGESSSSVTSMIAFQVIPISPRRGHRRSYRRPVPTSCVLPNLGLLLFVFTLGSRLAVEKLSYVDVLGFPHSNLMPAHATHRHAQCYELEYGSEDQEHFPWEFRKGDIVECEGLEFAEGEFGLVARRLYSCDASTF